MTTNLLMDTPMCREIYRAIRKRTVDMAGGTNADFDAAVKLEMDYQGVSPKPINWVLCANEIEREEHLRVACEAEAMEEQTREDEFNARWEAAMEAKYDFMKENP